MPYKVNYLAVFMLLSLTSGAQYVCAKIDVLGLVIPEVKAVRPSLEVSFLKRFSAVVTYENGTYKSGTKQINNNSPFQVYKLSGWGIIPELRWYPVTKIKPPPTGFFLGAFFKYRNVEEIYTGEDFLLSTQAKPINADVRVRGISYAGGVDIGYKVDLGNFMLEFLIGAGPAGGKWKEPGPRDHIDPFYKADLSSIGNAFRGEISLGLIFPRVRNEKILINPPSAVTMQDGLSEVARVIIYRPKRFSERLYDYDLYANDSLVKTIKNGTYLVKTFPPGEMKFKARTESVQALTLYLEKGKTYYLKCGFQGGMIISKPNLILMTPEEGQAESSGMMED